MPFPAILPAITAAIGSAGVAAGTTAAKYGPTLLGMLQEPDEDEFEQRFGRRPLTEPEW
jgi:hypothetical protein